MRATICPFATLVKGADWNLNGGRIVDPQCGIVHKTQGTGKSGLIRLGATRHHSTPGTFHFLICLDGELIQFYPVNVRCSHAAGANYRGCAQGELEGNTGEPCPAPQLVTLGRLARWMSDEWDVPRDLLVGDARVIGQGQASTPRVWIDRSDYRGFANHAAVAYPPDTSYHHYDGVTLAEWQIAIGAEPIEEQRRTDMPVVTGAKYADGHLEAWLIEGSAAIKQFGGVASAVGYPQEAIDYASTIKTPFITTTPALLDAAKARGAARGATISGPVTVTIDAAAVAAALPKALLDETARRLSA